MKLVIYIVYRKNIEFRNIYLELYTNNFKEHGLESIGERKVEGSKSQNL